MNDTMTLKMAFIACIRESPKNIPNIDLDLEDMTKGYYLEVLNELKSFNFEVECYSNPQKMVKELILQNKKIDYLFNLYYGDPELRGRNRKTIIPIIGEIYKIPYFGADAHVQAIAKDKYLTKLIMDRIKIPTPQYCIIMDHNGVEKQLDTFPLPAIVKPNFEGGSIGIEESNVINKKQNLIIKVKELLKRYRQPILVEKFIEGRELTVPICGNSRIILSDIIETTINGKSFRKEIFDKNYKWVDYRCVGFKGAYDLKPDIRNKILNYARRLHYYFIPTDITRIDLRLSNDGIPYFLEVNPDVHIGSLDAFAIAFKINDISFHDMFKKMLQVSFYRWNLQHSF